MNTDPIMWQWNNFENWSIFGDDIDKSVRFTSLAYRMLYNARTWRTVFSNKNLMQAYVCLQ